MFYFRLIKIKWVIETNKNGAEKTNRNNWSKSKI